MTDSLVQIAKRYPDTDKGSPDKGIDGGYLPIYEHHFAPVRESVRGVLEIGVRQGGSLRMWRDYFPNAKVIGLDIDPACEFREDRIEVVIGDVRDSYTCQSLAYRTRFDIIIDDGSHIASHVRRAEQNLSDLLMPRGFYCIEDLGCQVMEGHEDKQDEPAGFFSRAADELRRLNDPARVNIYSEFHFYKWLAIMRR